MLKVSYEQYNFYNFTQISEYKFLNIKLFSEKYVILWSNQNVTHLRLLLVETLTPS